jgi:hypothetical protein
MHKRNKIILGFSIAYWIVVAVGVALFSVAFENVPIGYYALKANYFAPNIENAYYVEGLYNKGIGFYFILFPRTKQIVIDNEVRVINKDL